MLKMEEQTTAVRRRERSKQIETRDWRRRNVSVKRGKKSGEFLAKVMAEKDEEKGSQRTSRARLFAFRGPALLVLVLMFNREANVSRRLRGSTNVGIASAQDIRRKIARASDLGEFHR